MDKLHRDWESFALLLIDVQEDFWASPMSQERPAFEQNVGHLLETCRREGIDIVHVRARFQPDRSDWMAKYRFRDSIPCVAGTPGVKVLPCALDEPGEFVIYKQSFDGFLKPALDAYLEKNDKRFVLVAGLVTSVCVLLTAASAAQRGYLVGVVEDCCADQSAAHGHTVARYPFVFERLIAREITANHAKWIKDLQQLAKMQPD
jgi:nicotinamidase-related amidase